MSANSEFFLSSKSSIVELDLLEISHPSFTMVHRIVRNAVNGVTVTLEDGTTVATFAFYPVGLRLSGADTDLDQTMEVSFGDLGEILPHELDAVNKASTFQTKPLFIYRTYRSDVLTVPLSGPVVFQVQNIAFDRQGSTLNVTAPKLNLNKTGESYNIDRFPALRII